MSVSHVSPSLHFHRRTTRSRTKLERQHRVNLVLGAIAFVLLAILVVGIIGIVTTVAPNAAAPTAGYPADGATYVTMTHMGILWLWVTLMNIAAILGFGIAASAIHQK